ncbi:MAG: PKD domain-containing protein, partial [bacterium]
MFTKLRVLTSFALVSALTACGGGGGGGSSSGGATFTPADANAAYTGERNKALLTQQNGMKFVQALLGVDPSGQIIFRTQTNAQRITNSIQAQQVIAKLVKQANINSVGHVASHSERRQQRAVSDSGSCAEGGTLSYSGDLNENTLQGVITYRLNNCHSEGVTINGTMQVRINQYDFNYDQPKSADISFDNLTMTYAGQTYTSIGTQAYSHGAYPALSTIVSNITETNPDGDQVYSKDLTYKTETDNFLNSYSGRVYLDNDGYVVITTPERISEFNGTMEQGVILFAGAAGSKIKIMPHQVNSYTDQTRADLDADGDGKYEFIAIQDDLYNWNGSSGFELNKPPVMVIGLSSEDEFGSYLDVADINKLILQRKIHVYEESSTDPEGGSVSNKVWTMESKPDGSTATLQRSDFSEQGKAFTPDVPGMYSISFKGEDADANIGISFINLTVLGNQPPVADIDHYFGEVYVGRTVQLSAFASSDPEDGSYGGLNYQWKFVEKPLGSASVIGSPTADDVDFVLDVSGKYIVSLTVTDSDGASDTVTKTFIVPENTAPTAVISDYSLFFTVGKQMELSGENSTDLESESSILLDYAWEIVSKPTGSTAVPQSSLYWLFFTPDVAGEYVFKLTV